MLEKFTDEYVMAEAKRLLVAYKLKTTLRYHTTRDFTKHSESVAEHVFALLYLAHYFLPLEDPEQFMDWGRVHRILLYHDFGEIIHGDVPYHLKNAEHETRERVAAGEVFAMLPASLAESGYAAWRGYEQRGSQEARFVDALDKIEPVFELFNEVNEISMKRLEFTFEQHIGKKRRTIESCFPVMWRFVEVISADMLARDVFWAEDSTAST